MLYEEKDFIFNFGKNAEFQRLIFTHENYPRKSI